MLFNTTETYKLTVSNPGTGDADNVVVRMAPSGQEAAADRHVIGTLAAGASRVIHVKLTAMQAGSIAVTAQATGDGELVANAVEKILVRRAEVHAATEGPALKYAGTTAKYTIRVTNPGNATAQRVRVEAVLPAGARCVSAGGGTVVPERGRVDWTVGALRPGADESFEITCLLSQPGVNQLRVTALADGNLSHVATATTQVEALADLKLELTDPAGPMPVGDDLVYELRIRNRGTKAAEGVGVVAYFSEGVEPVKVDGGKYKLAVGQVTVDPLARVAPGEEVLLKVVARASTAGNHLFRAELTCRSPQTRLVAEETTTVFGEAAPAGANRRPQPAAAQPGRAAASAAPAGAASAVPSGAAPASTLPSSATPAAVVPSGPSPRDGQAR
jgi:uncharacterized repeat protein (TIGR01451 family)